MKKVILLLGIIVSAFSLNAFGQPRPVDKTAGTTIVPPKPAPASFAAKYEGGMFGYAKKEEGTLKFDDDNERLVFFGKDQKEKFSIPFKAMLIISPQSQSVQSTAGKVVSVVPYAGLLGGFIKEKRRYLIINYSDPDVEAKGLANFRLDDRELLDSVLFSLAQKAELKQRGDAYYRPKTTTTTDDQ
jgi:hypothetical protein